MNKKIVLCLALLLSSAAVRASETNTDIITFNPPEVSMLQRKENKSFVINNKDKFKLELDHMIFEHPRGNQHEYDLTVEFCQNYFDQHVYPIFDSRFQPSRPGFPNVYISEDDKESSDLLIHLYDNKIINDEVVDYVLQALNLPEIRLNSEQLMIRVNQKLKSDLGLEMSDELILQELQALQTGSKKDQILWEVVQKLDQNVDHKHIALSLAQDIEELSQHYADAQFLISNTAFADGSELNLKDRYFKGIVPLLNIPFNLQDDQMTQQLRNLSKVFFNNDNLSQDQNTPNVIQNFTNSAENIFEILNLAREQNKEIAELKAQIQTLKLNKALDQTDQI